MISKSDWQKAHEEALAEGRRRVGPPPSVEDVEALFRGDLKGAEADRVRELLAYYPDMARAMTEPFSAAGDTELTAEELAADLAAIRRRAEALPLPPAPFRRRARPLRYLVAAAGLLLVVAAGGLYLRALRDSQRVVTRILDADGLKGSTPGTSTPAQTPIQLSTGSRYLLKPLFRPARSYGDYRLDLVDIEAAPPRVVWTRSGVRRQTDGSFPIELSTAEIAPGLYELVLYGVDQEAVRLATYTLRFSPPTR